MHLNIAGDDVAFGQRPISEIACGGSAFGNTGREPLRVLFASPEIFPLAKTGGLGDVSAALPAALAGYGVDMRLIMPGYEEALDLARSKRKPIELGCILDLGETRLIAARTPDSDLPILLVDCPSLYRRRGDLYSDPEGREWPDNPLRFALLCHAVARVALGAIGTGWTPNVVHLNDWHLGLVAPLLLAQSGRRPGSILTIHNLAFQGVFPADVFPRLGLPNHYFVPDGVEFHGGVSFLKAGIRFADLLTTVSPRYAEEILTPAFGCGLDGLLRDRQRDLVGILNGIDHQIWTPSDPVGLSHPFSVADLSGKPRCKTALQKELGLDVHPHAPLIAYVSRLTEQKMADLLPEIGPVLAEEGAQLAICGQGDRGIEETLSTLGDRFPRRIAVRIGYEEALARRILAGADILAAPARFEPCGLTQMYAMQFGAIPIVRHVGGLADSVIGYEGRDGRSPDQATGFSFELPTASAFIDAIQRACSLYREPAAWMALQTRAMSHDSRWQRPAESYLALYARVAR